MTIGFDASRAFIGQRTGTENYSYELLKHLLAIDTENTYRVYLRSGQGLENEILQVSNVQIIDIRAQRLWTQAGLAWQVLKNSPDVLFIPAHTLPVIRRPQQKTIVTIHDLGAEYLPQYHQFPQKLYLNRSTEYAVKHATKLIAVSQATKENLIAQLHANPEKISVIYEGYDADHFRPQNKEAMQAVQDKHGLTKPYFLFVGTIQPRKNLERLIEAFAYMVHHYLENEEVTKDYSVNMRELRNIELVLAGKKGWLSDAIYQAPKKYGVTGRVKFLDYVSHSDMPGLYAGALTFVFPSLYEGFGLPVLEAMACGVPVLTSNTSSLPEVGGQVAFYADPYSVDDLAGKLYMLLSQEKLRHKAKSGGIEHAKQFSWQKCAVETLKVLQSITV